MTPGVVWLASFLLFPIAGAPLLTHPSYRRLGLPSLLVLSGAVGCVGVTTVMTICSLLGVAWHPALVLFEGGLLAAAARVTLRRTAGRQPPPRRPLDAIEWIASGVMLVSVACATFASGSASATSPDLFLFWGPKAIAFASARGIQASYLLDPLLRYQHFSYPPLVSNAYAFATLLAGRLPWMAAVMTFPLLLASLVVALPGALQSFCSRRAAFVGSAAIAAALALVGRDNFVAGNADSALLVFEVLAMALLLSRKIDERASLLLAGILLAGATAAKVEGLGFALAAGALGLVLRRRAAITLPSAAVRLLGPVAFVAAAWFGFEKVRLGFFGYESYGSFLETDWRSLGRVVQMVARQLAISGGGLPWLVPFAAFLIAVPIRREALLPSLTAMALAAFFLFTYLHGGDPTLWITWSAGRIFAVVSPLLVLASLSGESGQPPSRESRSASEP